MSDFTGSFWSIYIIVGTLGGIIGCLLLLWITALRRAEPNPAGAADNTTGHVWDVDLREANNPMPRWWMGLFVLTIVFGLGYLFLYPGLGTYKGGLGWTQIGEYQEEMQQADKQLEPVYRGFAEQPVEQLARNPEAMAIGQRLFLNNCAQCHGSDAKGSKGFPNLTDRDWLYGGTPDKIIESITKGRVGVMPPMAAAVGSPDDVERLANYVMSLSSDAYVPVKAELGRPKFGVCAACHGRDGKGMPELGTPNLTDRIWLHGSGINAIINMIQNGKHSEMPAQEGRLTAQQIRVLAAYVWGLSNPAGAPGQAQSPSR